MSVYWEMPSMKTASQTTDYQLKRPPINSTVIQNSYFIDCQSLKRETPVQVVARKRRNKQSSAFAKLSSYPVSKWINYIIFFISSIICAYQLGTFCSVYFGYPTTVYIRLATNPKNPIPAIAICNKNEYRRSALCNISQVYCDKNRMFDPEVDLTPEMEMEILKNYSHFTTQGVKLFKTCSVRSETNVNIDITSYCHTNARWIFNGAHVCWTINSRWEETILKHVNETNIIGVEIILNFEHEEYTIHDIDTPYRGYVYFLSPDDVPTNGIHSFTIYSTKGYYIKFTKSNLYRLKPPYETMCRDYIEEWNSRGQQGSYSQQTCYYHCLWDNLQERCGCIPSGLPYPIDYRPCSKMNKSICTEVVKYEKHRCSQSCPDSCRTSIFGAETYGMHDYSGNGSRIWLDVRDAVQFSYLHRERFTPVELFGYVGGYTGIWLGLSVPRIFELFQELFLHIYNKRKLATKKTLPSSLQST